MAAIGGRRVGTASQDAGTWARSSTMWPEFIAAVKCARCPAVKFMDAIAKVNSSTHATDLHRTLSHQFLTEFQQFRKSIEPKTPVVAHCGQELLKKEARPWLHRSVGDMHHQRFQLKPTPRLSKPTLRPCWRQFQASPRARRKKQGPRLLSRLLIARASGGTRPWRLKLLAESWRRKAERLTAAKNKAWPGLPLLPRVAVLALVVLCQDCGRSPPSPLPRVGVPVPVVLFQDCGRGRPKR